jgi:hypothetical protein
VSKFEIIDKLLASVAGYETQKLAYCPCERGRAYNGFMVVGIAPNGGMYDFNASDMSDSSKRKPLVEYGVEPGHSGCPQDWVKEYWNKWSKIKFGHDVSAYSVSKSAFWSKLRKVLAKLGISEADDFASHVVWSNLYKVSYSAGGNPDGKLATLQFESAKELLKWELDNHKPNKVLFSTNGWAVPFLQDLWVKKLQPADETSQVKTYGFIQTKNGPVKCVLAKHPERKPERWSDDVVQAFNLLDEVTP